MMNRRELVQSFARSAAAFGAVHALPAFTAEPSAAAAFDAAAARQPLLTPLKGIGDVGQEATQDLRCDALALTGRWPAALRGRLLRNGPALFERGTQRYQHWFDGDGMVQQFSFGERGGVAHVSHLGRLVRTPKLLAEQRAGRFLFNAFGSAFGNADAPAQGPDTYNVANTNAIEHAGRVLALWEGGSAFALDPADLRTLGPVTWQAGYEQVPFSAHPKLDAAGHLWNIGTQGAKLIAWHIGPDGLLANVQLGESPYPGGMVHDMAVTAQYLVVPLPPVQLNFGQADAKQAFAFDRAQPLRILVMRKDDIGQRRVFELPAQMVFHVGNAFERGDGRIALSFVGAPDARFLTEGAPGLLRGTLADSGHGSTQFAELDMRSGRASVQALRDVVEFPRIAPGRIGLPSRQLVSAAAWVAYPGRPANLFHGVQLRDTETGAVQRYDYGEHAVVEEHIVVGKPGARDERDAWLLGTTFDAQRQASVVNLLDARHVADGPIAQAALPYWLPLGFHGNFTAA